MKAIAILSKSRSPSLPDLPSAHEQGLTDFDIPSWYALFLPKGTPDAIVRQAQRGRGRRHEHAGDAGAAEDDRLRPGRRRSAGRRTISARFVADEIEKWAGPISASGVQF